jgi:hypothetical protein
MKRTVTRALSLNKRRRMVLRVVEQGWSLAKGHVRNGRRPRIERRGAQRQG